MVFDFKIRPTRKAVFYLILIGWVLLINIWLFNYKYSVNNEVQSIYHTEEYTLPQYDNKVPHKFDANNHPDVKLLAKLLLIKDLNNDVDNHATNYNSLLNNHKLVEILNNLPFGERCDLYFKNLYLNHNSWFLDPNKHFPLDHRFEFDYNSFRNNVMNQAKEDYANDRNIPVDQVEVNNEVEEIIKNDYRKFWGSTMNTEQEIIDYLSHLRIFNKCYVNNDNNYQISKTNKFLNKQKNIIKSSPFKYTDKEQLLTNSFDSCNDIESRIYKWLSFSYPIYERWTGEIFLTPPNLKKFVSDPEVFRYTNSKFHSVTNKPIKSKLTNNKACFLNNFKNSLNGKGIVLSIGEHHVDDTVRLIHLLRALNNKYPIQIVNYDNLSKLAKQRIVNAARNKLVDLPASYETVKHNFPPDYFNVKDGGLPKQEVWFVNAFNAVNNNYKGKFDKYSAKFLAALFNSFSEYLLIDADTVLVQPPEYFFNMENYVKYGAYFFKDRTAPEFRPLSDGKFFKKITPSILDNLMFDIPVITQKTLDLEFFDGMGHFMESGLVLINRDLHFNSVLTMIQLNFFHPAASRVYGDKELFWLGFAANGDEDYHFNKYFVAAIGTESPDSEKLNEKGLPTRSREICSAHPGHINGEDGKTLIWFNSGFKFCGQSDVIDYKEEVKKQSRLTFIKDAQELKKYYEDPIPLKQAIVPPFKNKLETLCENVEGEPKEGWHMDTAYCNSYLWCAYSSIGGMTNDGTENTQLGEFIDFDNKSIDLFKYYGDVWVGNE